MRFLTFCLAAIVGLIAAGVVISHSLAPAEAPAAELANPLIDYDGFAQQAEAVKVIREPRRISESEFIKMAKDPQTIVLDCRSRAMYKLLHVKGAVNLPFTDFTADELAAVIPTKETRVLIYCNNNFENAPEAFAFKRPVASLNLHTYNQLHNYGYTNIYELKPLLDRHTTKIEFAGLEADVEKLRSENPRDPGTANRQAAMAMAKLENPNIDVDGFMQEVKLVQEIRELRRVSEEEFIRKSLDPKTVVLDARSPDKFKLLHVRGAVNLTFPDVTEEALAKVIPTKDTRVLIYCNNNFKNAPIAFAPKHTIASLNIHTFIVLHNYGYTNVYELKPLLDRETTKIAFEGTEIDAQE